MSELKSLPESLSQQIRAVANGLAQSSDISPTNGGGRQPVRPDQMSTEHRVAIEIGRQSPELLAAVILHHLGVVGLEVVESEEHSEDRLVKQNNGNYHYTEIEPFVTRKTIRRSVRLFTRNGGTVGEQP